MVAVLGGSTNAETNCNGTFVDIEITLKDFQDISDKTPLWPI
jgi:dihydroxy-acid dehydratase